VTGERRAPTLESVEVLKPQDSTPKRRVFDEPTPEVRFEQVNHFGSITIPTDAERVAEDALTID